MSLLPWAKKNRSPTGRPRIAEDPYAYREYIRSPAWREKRKRVMERDGFRCQDCNGIATEIHHLTYDRLFNEDLEDLVALCAECHRARHGRQKIPQVPTTRKSKRWTRKPTRRNRKRKNKRNQGGNR